MKYEIKNAYRNRLALVLFLWMGVFTKGVEDFTWKERWDVRLFVDRTENARFSCRWLLDLSNRGEFMIQWCCPFCFQRKN